MTPKFKVGDYVEIAYAGDGYPLGFQGEVVNVIDPEDGDETLYEITGLKYAAFQYRLALASRPESPKQHNTTCIQKYLSLSELENAEVVVKVDGFVVIDENSTSYNCDTLESVYDVLDALKLLKSLEG